MTATMEAIIGAFFVDSKQNLNAVKRVLAKLGLNACEREGWNEDRALWFWASQKGSS